MDLSNLGYTKPLYILPFDHRSTFAVELFGLKNITQLSPEQKELIKEFKMLIYKGFRKSIEKGIPTDFGAILCDEEFGSEVLLDAKHNGFITILTIEKSGEDLFKFQYEDFKSHIETFKPNFTKVLIKFNPRDIKEDRDAQKKNLKKISDFSRKNGYKFLLEVLVIPTKEQLHEAGGNRGVYDRKIRPGLTVEVIKELQDYGIEPDIWKMEGLEAVSDYRDVVQQAKSGGRKNVNLVILGRGANEEKVDQWLKIGAKVDGVVGFAVGRTVFWSPLEKFYRGQIGKSEVIETICDNFLNFYNIFTQSTS